MSLGKGVIFIGLGAGVLAVAIDPGIWTGMGDTLSALGGLIGGVLADKGGARAALANVLNGKAPDDPSQSLGDWLLTKAGDPVINGLTHGGPLQVTQGGKSDMTPQCAKAWSDCKAKYTNQADINLCVSNYPPGDPCGLVNGQGGPFAGYYAPHAAGMGSVIYHA